MDRKQKKLARKQQKAKQRAAQYAASAARKHQKHKKVVTRPVKVNGYKSAKLHNKQNRKKIEAETRQKDYVLPTVDLLGTKEKVKQNIITPCEALIVCPKNTKTEKWLTKKKISIGCK